MSPIPPARNQMKANDLVLAVVAEAGEVPGRTSLQKISYFASAVMDADIPFVPHFFGPFSADIASSSDTLVGANLLSEQVESGMFFRSGKEKEWTRHTYRTTPAGNTYIAWLREKGRLGDRAKLISLVSRLKDATMLEPDSLSKLAKVHYIRKKLGTPNPTPSDISRVAKSLGWYLPPSLARKFLSQLNALGL